jgi:hypothetical protein
VTWWLLYLGFQVGPLALAVLGPPSIIFLVYANQPPRR